MVEDVYSTTMEIFASEFNTIDIPWHFNQFFLLFALKYEVSLVKSDFTTTVLVRGHFS